MHVAANAPRLGHPGLVVTTSSRTAMKTFCALLLAAACFAAPAVQAAEPEPQVHGVKLASICTGCGVVYDVHTETRTGKASGVGAVGGAVVGGVVGHQLGNGAGQTALTVLGALGGGVAGNAIEKKVKKVTVWITQVTFKDGSTQTFEQTSDPRLEEGDIVKIENGQPVRHAG